MAGEGNIVGEKTESEKMMEKEGGKFETYVRINSSSKCFNFSDINQH